MTIAPLSLYNGLRNNPLAGIKRGIGDEDGCESQHMESCSEALLPDTFIIVQ